jgi:hypothetical protein
MKPLTRLATAALVLLALASPGPSATSAAPADGAATMASPAPKDKCAEKKL